MPLPAGCNMESFRQKPPGYFDRRSFRTICPTAPGRQCRRLPKNRRCDSRRVIGCKKDQWDAKKQRCRIGTETQTVHRQVRGRVKRR